jgi:hypothetical protein
MPHNPDRRALSQRNSVYMRLRNTILGVGCRKPRATPLFSQAKVTAKAVTFCQFASNLPEYVGKLIRIAGVYRFGIENQVLEQPECCPGKKLQFIRFVLTDVLMSSAAHSMRLVNKMKKKHVGIVLIMFRGTSPQRRTGAVSNLLK